MAYAPSPAGPRNLRQMFHYTYRALQDLAGTVPDVPAAQLEWLNISAMPVSYGSLETTDNAWVEIDRKPIAPGEGSRFRLRATAKRTDGFGYYYAELVGLAMRDTDLSVSTDKTSEFGSAQLDVRVVADGNDAVTQINGATAENWSWNIVGFHKEIV